MTAQSYKEIESGAQVHVEGQLEIEASAGLNRWCT